MNQVRLPKIIYDELLNYAQKAAPLEACGLLAGDHTGIKKFYPMRNVDASKEHYSMDPQEQFSVVQDMRKNGWEIIGIWHSHPETPPRLSVEDKRLAHMPNVNYLILSLEEKHYGQIHCFYLDENKFVEQAMEIC